MSRDLVRFFFLIYKTIEQERLAIFFYFSNFFYFLIFHRRDLKQSTTYLEAMSSKVVSNSCVGMSTNFLLFRLSSLISTHVDSFSFHAWLPSFSFFASSYFLISSNKILTASKSSCFIFFLHSFTVEIKMTAKM